MQDPGSRGTELLGGCAWRWTSVHKPCTPTGRSASPFTAQEGWLGGWVCGWVGALVQGRTWEKFVSEAVLGGAPRVRCTVALDTRTRHRCPVSTYARTPARAPTCTRAPSCISLTSPHHYLDHPPTHLPVRPRTWDCSLAEMSAALPRWAKCCVSAARVAPPATPAAHAHAHVHVEATRHSTA